MTANKIKNFLTFVVFAGIVASLSLMFVLGEDEKESISERRPLKQYTDVVNSKDPFGEFEGYFLDQFPMRDSFRRLKAFVVIDVLMKNDNNGYYKHNGSIVDMDREVAQLDENRVNYNIEVINRVIETYFKNNDVYYSIIPDKHFVASKENGYDTMDYGKMFDMLDENLNAQYIDITNKLEISDYYITDSHWSQDKITHVAEHLANSMSADVTLVPQNGYKENILEPFYGVYYNQSMFMSPADKIVYLTTDSTDDMKMTVINDNGMPEEKNVYVVENFKKNDSYDVFTDGARPLITIENPEANSSKQLILFRDSFGSSIAPLFAEGYSKVTMIDLRYMFPDAVGMFVRDIPEDADVLFLYSTGLVNGSSLRNFQKK